MENTWSYRNCWGAGSAYCRKTWILVLSNYLGDQKHLPWKTWIHWSYRNCWGSGGTYCGKAWYTGPSELLGSRSTYRGRPEYTGLIGTAGDQEAPTVERPEYTGPIGTAAEAPVERPEYRSIQTAEIKKLWKGAWIHWSYQTAGDQEAPTVERPEYTGPIGTTEFQKAPTVERPEYTGPIGTGSDQAPPSNTVPEFKLKSIERQDYRVQWVELN